MTDKYGMPYVKAVMKQPLILLQITESKSLCTLTKESWKVVEKDAINTRAQQQIGLQCTQTSYYISCRA